MPEVVKSLLPPQTGFELVPESPGLFGIFIPVESTNLINWGEFPDPTVHPITSYNSSILDQVDYNGRRFPYVMQIGTSAGAANYGFSIQYTLTAGISYTFSLDVALLGGGELNLQIINSVTGQVYGEREIHCTGFWQRDDCYVTAHMLVTAGCDIVVRRTDPSRMAWFVDGLQLEQSTFPTSYIHPEYSGAYYPGEPKQYWQAGPTGAAEAVRPALSRSGGRLIRFSDIGFRVTGFRGLGIPAPDHIITPHALLHGGYFQRQKYGTREFQILGQFTAESLPELQRQRDMMTWLLADYDLFAQDPLTLRYQGADRAGCIYGREFDIYCRYAGGMEGNIQSTFGEQIALKFKSELPFVYEPGDFGARGRAVGVGLSTVTISFVSLSHMPSPGWIRMSGTSGRLLKIENKTTGQVIQLDHTFDPLDGGPEYVQFASEGIYFKQKAIRVYGNVNYDPLADPNLFISEEISHELVPGNDLPIWYAAPRTPYFDGLNVIEFTFDPTITTIVTDIFCHFTRMFYGVDAIEASYDF